MYATTEDPFTPAALSRYCAGRFKWRASGLEEPGTLVRKLMKIAERIGRRSVIIPVDDESATLVSEQRDQLARYFLIPPVPPGLPRQVASKHELYRLCCEHGVPAPASVHVTGTEEAVAFAKQATFPVVVKNSEPWVRRRAPVVTGTTVVRDASQLLALARTPAPELSLLLQEYIPQRTPKTGSSTCTPDRTTAAWWCSPGSNPLLAPECRRDRLRLLGAQPGAGPDSHAVLQPDRLPRGRGPRLAPRPA